MFNSQNYISNIKRTSSHFELDEIQWNRNQQPFHPDLIPFSNTPQELKEKLKELFHQNNKPLLNNEKI